MSRNIQTPGPSEQLTTRFGVKGAIALRVDEVVVPISVIIPPPRRPAIGSVLSTSGGGFASECSLTAVTPPNGTTLNLHEFLVHVTKIHVSLLNLLADRVVVVRPTSGISGFTNVTTKAFKEARLGATPPSVLGFKNTAAATVGTELDSREVVPGVPNTFTIDYADAPFILGASPALGGTNSIVVRTDTVTQAIRVVFEWSEAPLPI